MKKYIRTKNGHGSSSWQRIETPAPPATPSGPSTSAIQPPLPLEPPPPDVSWNIVVKREVEDPEYIDTSQELSPNIQAVPERAPATPQVPICRDFIRGTCKRIGTCKFAHKLDTSQTVGVYTFCRDFQTKVCTYANCKYVHADIFEEQHFYRTGHLPPEVFERKKNVVQPVVTTAFMQNQNIFIPPPPPPPPPPQEPQQPQPQMSFPNAVPSTSQGNTEAASSLNELRNSFLNLIQMNSQRRSWSSTEGFDMFDFSQPGSGLPIVCSNCEFMEFQLQYYKSKLRNMILKTQSLDAKITKEEQKIERADAVLTLILGIPRPTQASRIFDMNSFRGENTRELASLEELIALWIARQSQR